MEIEKGAARQGRPRAFCTEKALDAALKVFWQKGYEGASLTDLTKAMGINRPSLYAAFGNKEDLFRKALERYTSGPASYSCKALNEPTARAVVEKLLTGTVDMQTNPCNPPGCMAVQAALVCGDSTDPIRQELIAHRMAAESAIRCRFERAQLEGDLPVDVNPEDLARYIAVILQGLSVQAAGGATREDLLRVVQTVLRSWPEDSTKPD
jgi:AcrR family transcriptional regulator